MLLACKECLAPLRLLSSPLLTHPDSQLLPLSFNYLSLLSSLLIFLYCQANRYEPAPNAAFKPDSDHSPLFQFLHKAAKCGILSWYVIRLWCKNCFESGRTILEPGLGAWLNLATLSSFNGLTVLLQAGTRSRKNIHAPVFNQINSFRDQQ